jgi:FkbM family methyltransferase
MFFTHPLTRDDLAGAWLRFAWWQARSRLSDRVVVDWISGTKFVAHRGMTGFTGNIYAGLHEAVDMLFVLHFLRPGDVFADVGANVGSYTVLASGVVRAKTVAFEPDPETAKKLKKNIILNNLEDLVAVHEMAVGAEDGLISFTVGKDTVNHIALKGDADIRTVPVVRLDSLCAEAPPIMIKMDIEGFEEQALAGANGLLAEPTLQVVAVETVSQEIITHLARAQFARVYYDPQARQLSDVPGRDHASNQLFVRDRAFVTARVTSAPAVTVLGKSI